MRLNPVSSVTDRGWWSMHIHSIIFAVISLAFLLSGVYSSCFFRMSVMDGWVRVALLVTVAFFAVASFSYSPYDSRWLVLKCRMRFIVLNVLDNAPPREIYLEQTANSTFFIVSRNVKVIPHGRWYDCGTKTFTSPLIVYVLTHWRHQLWSVPKIGQV